MNALNHRWLAIGKSWRIAGCAAAALGLGFAAQAPAFAQAPASGSQSAVWVKKKIFFIYHGFTTSYSCEGLQDAMTSVLLQLGARKSDMDLRQTNCTSAFNAPTTNPGISGSFYVLEPASSSTPSAVNAEWQTVNVHLGKSDENKTGRGKQGTCELIDQVKQKVLPLFTTRDVKFDSNCQSNTLIIIGSTLQAKVLKPTAREASDVAGTQR